MKNELIFNLTRILYSNRLKVLSRLENQIIYLYKITKQITWFFQLLQDEIGGRMRGWSCGETCWRQTQGDAIRWILLNFSCLFCLLFRFDSLLRWKTLEEHSGKAAAIQGENGSERARIREQIGWSHANHYENCRWISVSIAFITGNEPQIVE